MAGALIPTPWERLFVKKLSDVRHSLKIACPFIKTRYARLLLASLSVNEKLDVQILTRLKPQDILAGVHDLDALGALMTPLTGLNVQMRYLNRLHAKLFVFDQREAIVTSTNLTYAGFNTNAELGVSLTDEASVIACEDHFSALWSGAAALRLDAVLKLKDELQKQVEIAQRERFSVRLTSPAAQEETRSAFEAAVDDASVPDPTPLPNLPREEYLEAEVKIVSGEDASSRSDDDVSPDADIAAISNKFQNTFGQAINAKDAMAVFAHASWFNENSCFDETVSLAKRRYTEVGFFAHDLIAMRHVLASSRETSASEQLVNKLQYVKQMRWHAVTLVKLGLGTPLLGQSLRKEFAEQDARIKYAQDVLMGILGWFALNRGVESLLALSDVFFDFSEQLPYDFASAIQHKSQLQEAMQGTHGKRPEYALSKREGSDHEPKFFVEVRLPDGRKYEGSGTTVKEAETNAAKTALKALGILGRRPSREGNNLNATSFDGLNDAQRQKLAEFWQAIMLPIASKPLDRRVAMSVVCSSFVLKQTREARLRARMSCFGSIVIHFYAAMGLATLWQRNGQTIPTHREFVTTLCSHRALEQFYERLRLEQFSIDAIKPGNPAGRTKVETVQAIMGYLFIACGDSQARSFFQTLQRTLAQTRQTL